MISALPSDPLGHEEIPCAQHIIVALNSHDRAYDYLIDIWHNLTFLSIFNEQLPYIWTIHNFGNITWRFLEVHRL